MSDEKKYCTECGSQNSFDNEFCTECGHPFEIPVDEVVNETNEIDGELVDVTSETSYDEPTETITPEEPIVPQSEVVSTEAAEVEGNDFINKAKNYIQNNKKTVGIVAGVLAVVVVLFFFLSGSTMAKGAWTTSDKDYYDSRERYSLDISRNGKVEVTMEHADELEGRLKMDFSVVEDEWATADNPDRTAYILDKMGKIVIVVPNLTYQYQRNEILNQFAEFRVPYDVKEGKNEVTITFDFADYGDLLYGGQLDTVLEVIGEKDRDNEYREEYIIFRGLTGREELFKK